MLVTVTAGRAVVVFSSQFVVGTEKKWKIALIKPASFSRYFQIVATTTSEVITGRKKAARKNARNLTVRLRRRAESRPSTGPIPMPIRTKMKVLRSDRRNAESWRSAV